jgi:hypothetical protein
LNIHAWSLLFEIVEELGHGRYARDQQMVARAGACDVKEMTLGLIDFLEIGVVTDHLDSPLQRCGAATAQLRAQFAWSTDQMPSLYTKNADRLRLVIEWRGG